MASSAKIESYEQSIKRQCSRHTEALRNHHTSYKYVHNDDSINIQATYEALFRSWKGILFF